MYISFRSLQLREKVLHHSSLPNLYRCYSWRKATIVACQSISPIRPTQFFPYWPNIFLYGLFNSIFANFLTSGRSSRSWHLNLLGSKALIFIPFDSCGLFSDSRALLLSGDTLLELNHCPKSQSETWISLLPSHCTGDDFVEDSVTLIGGYLLSLSLNRTCPVKSR